VAVQKLYLAFSLLLITAEPLQLGIGKLGMRYLINICVHYI
jgi:hypothetical protein